MINVKLPRLYLIAVALLSFLFLFLTDGMKMGFSGFTILRAVLASFLVFLICRSIKIFEFDADHLKILRGSAKVLKKGRIPFCQIHKVTWQDAQSVKIEFKENGTIDEFGLMADRDIMEALIGFIKKQNSQVVIDEKNQSRWLAAEIPKSLAPILILCVVIFVVGMIFVAKQRGWIQELP